MGSGKVEVIVEQIEVSTAVKWLAENAEWVFSGIGTVIFTSIVSVIFSVLLTFTAYKLKNKTAQFSYEAENIKERIKNSVRLAKGHLLSPHLDNAMKAISSRSKAQEKKWSGVIDALSNFLSNYDPDSVEYKIIKEAQENAKNILTELRKCTPNPIKIDELEHVTRVGIQEASAMIKNKDI